MSVAPINNLPQIAPISPDPKGVTGAQGKGPDFGSALADARALETKATQTADQFANGDQTIGIHEVMIQSEKANVALKFATTLKNKAIEAYKELMNTQV
jgi:flagellar hook-basal body complex protein FliE